MERAPISAALRWSWLVVFLASIAGGFVAIAMLGALCEDVGSAGSEAYCRHGGMEKAWLAVLVAVVWSIVVPVGGLIFRSTRAFVAGLVGPVIAIPLVLLLALAFGTG